jgi:fatty-acyl-CoA synthase
VRRLGSGSEPVDATVMESFAARAAGFGFDPGALYAGYGMAEATVAITIPPMGSGFSVDVVNDDALTRDLRADPVTSDRPAARRLARCGPPLRGMELRVVDPETAAVLPDRGVGEIEVRGPSVVPGYFRNDAATRAALRADGWLRTGDQGYVAEGDVIICGRIKDMIVIGGRNVFPEDLERAVQAVPGVRPGNVIAFGVDAGGKGESVVVAAEIKVDAADHRPDVIRTEIARAVRRAAGLRLEDVVLLSPGSLPKTSSGKLQRSACRARYRADELERL